MELFHASLLCLFVLLVVFLSLLSLLSSNPKNLKNLPPGQTGLPVIGETLQYLAAGWKGHPEKFIFDRVSKYSSYVYKTNLMREPTVVFCGAAAHKFLFSNENKLVQSWWPSSVDKIFPSSNQTSSKEEAIKMRKMLPNFFKPEALQRYIGIMDTIARHHFSAEWENKDQIIVFPLSKRYTFWLACRIFLSMEDTKDVDKFLERFNLIAEGLLSLPVDLPGTPFNRAIKASDYIRKDLVGIIKRRKTDLAAKKASPTQDILSHMLLTADEDGKYMKESDIADKILGLLVGGHDTASSACAFIVKFEGTGPAPYTFVPFGGGPRTCPGKEYARLEILVFMHNLVKRFRWEKLIPDEKIVVNPMPVPEKGLPFNNFIDLYISSLQLL
ncbi:hypothetical protein RHGRI_000891 [Rhododendron griersonianum]|uniref:Cytochrome P450 n=1 Tax=Rhododendron griersonianum TaxID=479676 RepID=A0AAV6LJF1_9ERIC|nr:hypothetical protein RHGRI_000891 [Rhododendron griersonianum]